MTHILRSLSFSLLGVSAALFILREEDSSSETTRLLGGYDGQLSSARGGCYRIVGLDPCPSHWYCLESMECNGPEESCDQEPSYEPSDGVAVPITQLQFSGTGQSATQEGTVSCGFISYCDPDCYYNPVNDSWGCTNEYPQPAGYPLEDVRHGTAPDPDSLTVDCGYVTDARGAQPGSRPILPERYIVIAQINGLQIQP